MTKESSKNHCKRSPCPISCTLDLLGDKWTLIVIRDLMMGKSRYSELADSPEGIPTNLLAERLKRLTEAGIVSRQPYQEKPARYAYQLTRKGLDLEPVLMALVEWSKRYLPDAFVPPDDFRLNTKKP